VPFVGDVRGFVTWEWWTSDMDLRRFFAENLLAAGLGYIARADGAGAFEWMVEEEFPLSHASQKHGFHDGDFFLRDDPVHSAYVRDTIVAAVEALGLTPKMFNAGTSHNPHRIDDFAPTNGMSRARSWARFQAHAAQMLRLWGVNVAGLRTEAFRRLIEEDPA
jgi:hypothetical protein